MSRSASLRRQLTGAVLIALERLFMATERSPVVVRHLPDSLEHPFVLVPVANPATADRMARIGAAIAASRGGSAVLVHITRPEEASPNGAVDTTDWRRAGERWPSVAEGLAAVEALGHQAGLIVRSATNVGRAIRRTALELDAAVIVLGWRETRASEDRVSAALRAVLEEPPCDLAVVGGAGDKAPARIVVPVRPRRPSAPALRMAANLADRGGEVLALRVLREGTTTPTDAEALESLEAAVKEAGLEDAEVALRLIKAPNPAAGILRVVDEGYDGVIMSSSEDTIFDRLLFGKTQMRVAEQGQVPVIVTKPGAGPMRYIVHRTWRAVDDVMPNLTDAEQSTVSKKITDGASPTIDLFVMIGLSAAIAGLGLLINSAAVIIGAMLVAPLLSAFVGVGLGIVQGNSELLRNALTASLKGAVLALAVGAAVGLLNTAGEPGAEILARTRPNLFDLGIALASGVAGAYALSRSNVQASLAGVAIAAAIIPPLATAGIGITLPNQSVALGALLHFGTNAVAIVLAAAVTFLLLGFGPLESERDRHVFRLGIQYATALVIGVAVVLGLLTWQLGKEERFRGRLVEEVRAELRSIDAELVTVTVLGRSDLGTGLPLPGSDASDAPLEIGVTARMPQSTATTLTAPDVTNMEARLENAIGQPVTLHLEAIPVLRVPERDIQPSPEPGRQIFP